jgi:hypothetical protein
MPLEDYLMPGEQVKFQSGTSVHHGDKVYKVIITDRRIVLYARRGMLIKSDDVVTQKFDELHRVKYQESGLIGKKGTIRIETLMTKMDLWGPATEVKALYQQMMQFM